MIDYDKLTKQISNTCHNLKAHFYKEIVYTQDSEFKSELALLDELFDTYIGRRLVEGTAVALNQDLLKGYGCSIYFRNIEFDAPDELKIYLCIEGGFFEFVIDFSISGESAGSFYQYGKSDGKFHLKDFSINFHDLQIHV